MYIQNNKYIYYIFTKLSLLQRCYSKIQGVYKLILIELTGDKEIYRFVLLTAAEDS